MKGKVNKMIIKMTGLYGYAHVSSYYRKDGYCFDFVSDLQYASQLTKEEVETVFEHKDWYLKQYGAKNLVVIDA